MTFKWIVGAVLLITTIVLTGCVTPTEKADSLTTRYVDEEAGVVCWVYTAFHGGGISCLPISETKLDR